MIRQTTLPADNNRALGLATKRADCIVVGGGAIGMSIAWELAQRGAQVLLLERSRVGRQASWAAAGILPAANLDHAIDPMDRLRGLSHRLHPLWAAKLKETTGIDTEFRRCGALYLASSPGEAASLGSQIAYWKEYGIEAESFSATKLVEDQPYLQSFVQRGSVLTAWLLPNDWQLRSPSHLNALRAACLQEGVEIIENADVVAISEQDNSIRVSTAKDPFDGAKVVLACGAWTPQLATSLGIKTGIFPVRGQMLLYRCQSVLLSRIVHEGNRYLVPRQDGSLLVGSCEEEVGYQSGTSPSVIASLRQWAENRLPDLADAVLERTWSGLRPGSFDTFPYIGRAPGLQNLFLAAGHFRSGLHLSCGTAVVLSDVIQGNKPQIDLDFFRVGRG